MPNPFVRSCPLLAAVIVSVALAAPAFAQAKPAPATPQAALDALEAAIAAGDCRATMALITPEGQKRLAKEAVMGSLAMLAFTDPDDPNPMGPKPTAGGAGQEEEGLRARPRRRSPPRSSRPGLDAAMGKPLMPADGDRRRQDRRGRRRDAGAGALRRRGEGGPALGMKQKPPLDEGRSVHRLEGGRRSRHGEVGPADDEDRQGRRQVAGRRAAARTEPGQ